MAYSSQESHTGQPDFCNCLADGSTTGYLLILLTNKHDLKPEIQKRILHANRAYYALTPILKSHAVHRAVKSKYINL